MKSDNNSKINRFVKHDVDSSINSDGYGTANHRNHTNNINKSEFSLFALLVGVTVGLTACQSPAGMKRSPVAMSQPQLLNLADNPSPSALAKARFVNAMKLHLASEHLSTSVLQYSIRPFVDKDSVDADSQSLFQTALQTYLYDKYQKDEQINPEEDSLIEQYIEEVKAEIAEAKESGDDSYDDYTEEDIRDEAEYRYLLYTYEQEYDEADSTNDMKSFFKSYMQMKREQVDKELNADNAYHTDDSSEMSIKDIYSGQGMIQEVLNMLHRTPEQIEAMQAHNLDYFSMQLLGHHQPSKMKYQGVISYDAVSPTQIISAQLPYGVDFKQASMTVDPSVVLPIVAFFAPDKLTLPKDMKSHTVTFTLPDKVREKIPTEVIYTAFLTGVERAFAEMDSEYFTPVDISDDKYAKKLGARRAVKTYWGSKESGEFLGKLLKSMSQTLQTYVTEHPELYEADLGADTLQEVLTTWALVERDFQSKDVGGLLQIIEAVAPINFHQSLYYYLDGNDNLMAYQAKSSVGSEIYGWMIDGVQQTRYDNASVQASPLYQLYIEDFADDAPKSINGNEWFTGDKEKELYRDARYARYDYKDWKTSEKDGKNTETIEDDEKSAGEAVVDASLKSDENMTEAEKARQAFNKFESN